MNVPQPPMGVDNAADVATMVEACVDIARLWVPDKFLTSRGW